VKVTKSHSHRKASDAQSSPGVTASARARAPSSPQQGDSIQPLSRAKTGMDCASKPSHPRSSFSRRCRTSLNHQEQPGESLLAPKPRRVAQHYAQTSRHRGGAQAADRIIDFKRNRSHPRQVAAIEYDPNRTVPYRPAALPRRRDSATSPPTASVGDMSSPAQGRIRTATRCPCGFIPTVRRSTTWSFVLAARQDGPQRRMGVQLVAKDGGFATLRLPSTEMRRVSIDCRATLGIVGNSEHELIKIGKAGRNRWKGIRPQTRA